MNVTDVSAIRECTSCSMCSAVCPVEAISLFILTTTAFIVQLLTISVSTAVYAQRSVINSTTISA